MRKTTKSFMEAIAILIPFLILIIAIYPSMEPEIGVPEDFYGTSREVSLTEMVEIADQFNMTIWLPSELPNNLELTTIYLKDGPFIAIIVYSAEGNKDYKTAELTVQISPSGSPPTLEELESQAETSMYITTLDINGWPVLVNEKAYTGGNIETREKYGDYILLVIAWISGMRYMISCPTLTPKDAIQIVRNMHFLIP